MIDLIVTYDVATHRVDPLHRHDEGEVMWRSLICPIQYLYKNMTLSIHKSDTQGRTFIIALRTSPVCKLAKKILFQLLPYKSYLRQGLIHKTTLLFQLFSSTCTCPYTLLNSNANNGILST